MWGTRRQDQHGVSCSGKGRPSDGAGCKRPPAPLCEGPWGTLPGERAAHSSLGLTGLAESPLPAVPVLEGLLWQPEPTSTTSSCQVLTGVGVYVPALSPCVTHSTPVSRAAQGLSSGGASGSGLDHTLSGRLPSCPPQSPTLTSQVTWCSHWNKSLRQSVS